MHIEIGILATAKLLVANATAVATLATHVGGLFNCPGAIAKTIFAAAFFSIFMEIYHLPVGPSELHMIGASAIYFTFGFLPTLFGLAIGLAAQGFLFEPQDLVHLGVNSLSLIVPLIAAHAAIGRHFFAGAAGTEVRWANIMKFDALYYAGVTGMVSFWLSLGDVATPVAAWALFALSYLPLVLLEPLFTCMVLKLLKDRREMPGVRRFTVVPFLNVR